MIIIVQLTGPLRPLVTHVQHRTLLHAPLLAAFTRTLYLLSSTSMISDMSLQEDCRALVGGRSLTRPAELLLDVDLHAWISAILDLVTKMEKNAILSKTEQFRAMVSIDDL